MNLESMYQEIILDHYRNPHHAGLREPFEAEVHHVNPTCGDEVTLRVHFDGTGPDDWQVSDVSYAAVAVSRSLPTTRSVITDTDACEIEQPSESYDTSRTVLPSSDIRTRSVTSSPQVGLTWCTSASNGSRSPLWCGLR